MGASRREEERPHPWLDDEAGGKPQAHRRCPARSGTPVHTPGSLLTPGPGGEATAGRVVSWEVSLAVLSWSKQSHVSTRVHVWTCSCPDTRTRSYMHLSSATPPGHVSTCCASVPTEESLLVNDH